MSARNVKQKVRIGRLLLVALSTFCFIAVPLPGSSQEYPSKPITVIVGYPPGSSTSIGAQVFVEVAKKYLSKQQPILLEHKAGAAQAIAADYISKEPADGYKLFWTDVGLITRIAMGGSSLHFNLDSFDYVGAMGYSASVVAVNKESPFKTIEDYISYAKKNPGKISIAHAGIGSGAHVGIEQMQMVCGIKLNLVAFTAAQIPSALLGGHVDAGNSAAANLGDHIKPGGGLRALAIMSRERWSEEFPDVPTFLEKGYNLDRSSWQFMVVRKGIPKPVLTILQQVLKKVADDPQSIEANRRAKFIHSYMGGDETERQVKESFKVNYGILKSVGQIK